MFIFVILGKDVTRQTRRTPWKESIGNTSQQGRRIGKNKKNVCAKHVAVYINIKTTSTHTKRQKTHASIHNCDL